MLHVNMHIFMPQEWNSGASSFYFVCLFVCLSMILLICDCDSVAKNFNIGHNFCTVRDKDFIIWYAYSTYETLRHAYSNYETLSNNTKVNDFVALTFILKIANFGFCYHQGHSCFTNKPVLFYFCLYMKY